MGYPKSRSRRARKPLPYAPAPLSPFASIVAAIGPRVDGDVGPASFAVPQRTYKRGCLLLRNFARRAAAEQEALAPSFLVRDRRRGVRQRLDRDHARDHAGGPAPPRGAHARGPLVPRRRAAREPCRSARSPRGRRCIHSRSRSTCGCSSRHTPSRSRACRGRGARSGFRTRSTSRTSRASRATDSFTRLLSTPCSCSTPRRSSAFCASRARSSCSSGTRPFRRSTRSSLR